MERAGSPPARTGSPWNLVSTYSSFLSPGLSVVSCPWGAAAPDVCDTSPLPRRGCSLAQVKLPVPVAAWCSVLGNGGLTQDSCFFSLPMQGCFGAGKAGAILVRRAWSPFSPRGLQQAPRCLSGHGGSLTAKHRARLWLQPGRAGAGWWHSSNGTAAGVSPWHGQFLGPEQAALPQGPGSGHPLPRTNPSSVGWALPAGVGSVYRANY